MIAIIPLSLARTVHRLYPPTSPHLNRPPAVLQAKVASAAGALAAKDDLREARSKHKSEVDSLKAELKKLQEKSSCGAKGKDLAQRELEQAKKKAADLELRLKGAMQEKTTAVQEKVRRGARVPTLCLSQRHPC